MAQPAVAGGGKKAGWLDPPPGRAGPPPAWGNPWTQQNPSPPWTLGRERTLANTIMETGLTWRQCWAMRRGTRAGFLGGGPREVTR